MSALRVFLFLGMVFHKFVWEVLKKREGAPEAQERSTRTSVKSLVKFGKTGVLGFLLFQTLFLELLPISKQPKRLRIIGTAVYLLGLSTAVFGRIQLGDNWANIEDYQVLPEQSLVTDGVYRYIRHPIYTGDILLLFGLEMALNSWLALGVFVPLLVAMRNATREEILLSDALPGYDVYREQTKRFIPFIL